MDVRLSSLVTALDDPSPEARRVACRRLGEAPSPDAVEPLAALLEDPDGAVRAEAARSLGLCASRRSLSALMAALDTERTGAVRSALLGAILAVGGSAATRRLREILMDPSSTLHVPLLAALKDSRNVQDFPSEIRELLDMPGYPWQAELLELAPAFPAAEAEAMLLSVVARPGAPAVRARAVRALAAHPSARNWAEVAPLLRASEEDVRLAAIDTLTAYNPERLIDEAADLLALGGCREKTALLAVMADHASVEQLAPVAAVLRRETDPGVLDAALRVLLRRGLPSATVASAVADLAGHPAPRVRANVAEVLGRPGLPESVPTLDGLSGDAHRGVRRAVARALGQVEDDRSVGILVRMVEDATPDVRLHALRSLAAAGADEVRSLVVERLADASPKVRVEALTQLENLELDEIPEELIRLATDPDAAVRRRAARLLRRLGGDVEEAPSLDLAHRHRAEGRTSRAREVFEALVARDAGCVEAVVELGRMALDEGDAAAARRLVMEALESRPGHEALLTLAADAARREARVDLEIEYLERLAARDGANWTVRRRLGLALVEASRWRAAVPHLEAVLPHRFNDEAVHLGLGRAFAGVEDLDAARTELTWVLERNPFQVQAQEAMAALLARGEQHAEAVASLRRLVEQLPDRPDLVERLARAALASGDAELARSSFEDLVRRDPSRVEIHLEVARIEMAAGRAQRAMDHVSRFLEARPDDPAGLMVRVEILEGRGQISQALEACFHLHAMAPATPGLLHRIGRLYEHNGQTEQALACYRDHLETNPLDVDTGLRLAQADVERRLHTEAIRKLVRCMKVAPEDLRPVLALARLYRDLGDDAEALRFADRAAELAPADPELPMLRAELYLRLGAEAKARECCHAALERREDLAEAHRLLGSLYFREGSWTRVVYHFNRLPVAFAEDPSYGSELGRAYQALGHTEKAREWLEASHRLDGGCRDVLAALAELELAAGETGRAMGYARELLALDDADPDGLRLLGFALSERGADEEAEGWLRRALVAAPENPRVRERLALVRHRLGRHSAALELYPELSLLPSADPAVRLLKGLCYLGQGNLDRAGEVADEALRGAPFDTEALALKGDVLAARGDLLGAETALNAAIRTNPTDGSLFTRRGHVLLRRRCFDRSRLDLLKALERDALDEDALRLLGRLEIEADRPRAALEHLDRLVAHRPADPAAHALRARAYRALGDEASALESLRNVASLEPGSPEARLELGTALLAAGADAEGREHLEAYLELSDDRLPALRALAELHERDGNVTEARFYLRQLLAEGGTSRDVLARLAEVLFRGGRTDEAWALLEETRDSHPDLPAFLGRRALEASELTLGRDLLRAAVGRSPGDAESLLSLARCHYLRAESALARAALERIFEHNDGDGRAWYQLGLLDLLDEQPDAALKALRRTVELEPRHGDAWLRLGAVLLTAGKGREAAEAANGAIAAGASRVDALRLLARALVLADETADAIEVLDELRRTDPRDDELLTQTTLMWRSGRLPGAAALLRERTASGDAPSELRVVFGRILTAMKEYGEAVVWLAPARETRDADALRDLVTSTLALDRLDGAAAALRRLLEICPDDLTALMAAGTIAERSRNTTAAERAWKQAVERHPRSVEARLRLASLHAGTGRLREALAGARAVTAAAPACLEALVLQARLLGRLDMHAKALAAWEALRLLPGGDRPEYALELSRALRRAGEPGRASRLLEELSNGDETGAPALRERVEAAFEAGSWSEALQLYRVYRTRHPQEPEMAELAGLAHVNLGMTVRAVAELQRLVQQGLPAARLAQAIADRYQAEGRPREAERVLAAALERESEDRNLLRGLATVQTAAGSMEDAERTLLRLLRLHPGDVEAASALGRVYERSRQYEKMRGVYVELVRDNPYSAEAHLGLARAELLTGRPDRALAGFKKAQELDRSSAEASMGLAEACRLTGDREGAIEAYREVLRLDGRNERALYELGTTYQAVQKRELAVFHLERLLEVAPPDSRFVGLARNLLEENRRRLLN